MNKNSGKCLATGKREKVLSSRIHKIVDAFLRLPGASYRYWYFTSTRKYTLVSEMGIALTVARICTGTPDSQGMWECWTVGSRGNTNVTNGPIPTPHAGVLNQINPSINKSQQQLQQENYGFRYVPLVDIGIFIHSVVDVCRRYVHVCCINKQIRYRRNTLVFDFLVDPSHK